MTKLEWCRAHAPEALKSMDDAELLDLMSEAYELFCNDKETIDQSELESVEYNPVNSQMDYMVLELVREFGDRLAFKGGYMLTKLMPDIARQTTDVDFSIQDTALYQCLIKSMERIGEHFKSIGECSSYKIKQEITPTMSGGMDIYDAFGRKFLGIDVGWHDITYGTTTVSIDICDLRAFEVERMLADKISAILSRKRFRRPKDLYDLYCITNCFDFDANKVNDYILYRTQGAGADWQNYPFNEVVEHEYQHAYESLKVESIAVGYTTVKPSWDTVYGRFNTIAKMLREKYINSYWYCKEQRFGYAKS